MIKYIYIPESRDYYESLYVVDGDSVVKSYMRKNGQEWEITCVNFWPRDYSCIGRTGAVELQLEDVFHIIL